MLLMGKTTQGVLSIAYMALAARTLGAVDFGILIILNGLVVAVSEIARFDSWQVVLRYGTAPYEVSDRQRLHQVLKFTLLLDVLGSGLGLAVVLGGLAAAMHVFGLPPELEDPARVFSLSVAFLISTGGANGILRLVDRFDLIAWQTTLAPVVRFAGTVALFVSGADLEAFLWLWLGATIAGRTLLHVLAWRQLHQRGLLNEFANGFWPVLAADRSVWAFAFGTSANATLAVVDKHTGILGVGWLIGPAASGFYRVALHLADLLIKPSRAFLTPAIYPELARLTARNHVEAREQMVWRSVLVAGGVSLAVLAALALFGDWFILLVFGPGFEMAYGVMVLLALAGAVNIGVFPLEPLLVSAGRVRVTVVTRLIAVVVYLVVLYTAVLQLGLIGAGVASCVYAALRAVILVWFARAYLTAAKATGQNGS